MVSYSRQRGVTLIELLFTITIVSIVLSFAIPGMQGVVGETRRHSATSELIAAINLARNTAIQEQLTVTLCPLNEKLQCGHDWNKPITVFRDPNRSKSVTDSSQVVRVIDISRQGRVYAHSGNRSYFRFRSSGMAREAIGNLIWCPENDDNTVASQIRVNMGGRPLLAQDHDGDNIVEDTYGKPIKCE